MQSRSAPQNYQKCNGVSSQKFKRFFPPKSVTVFLTYDENDETRFILAAPPNEDPRHDLGWPFFWTICPIGAGSSKSNLRNFFVMQSRPATLIKFHYVMQSRSAPQTYQQCNGFSRQKFKRFFPPKSVSVFPTYYENDETRFLLAASLN